MILLFDQLEEIHRNHYYLNCQKKQFSSFMESLGIPVHYFFYNSYENIARIIKHFWHGKRDCWNYPSATLEMRELEEFGITLKEYRFKDYEMVQPFLMETIQSGCPVFAAADIYHLPFHAEYGKKHLYHLFIISGYKKEEGKLYWKVTHFPPFFSDWLNTDVIRETYEKSSDDIYMYLLQISERTFYTEFDEVFRKKYYGFYSSFQDDYLYYKEFSQLASDIEANYYPLFHSVTTLLGSRDLFSRFLKRMNEPEELIKELDGICLKLNGLRMTVLRSVESRTIKASVLQDKLDELYERENRFLQSLQAHIKQSAGLPR